MQDDIFYTTWYSSPVGKLTLIGSSRGLYAILWESDSPSRVKLPEEMTVKDDYPLFVETKMQLAEYFDGSRKVFDIPLDMSLGTQFQKKAWQALLQIPYGERRSYAEQAILIGNKNATRAIGGANSRNPFSIIVPCHRVVGSKGKLTGFAGGLEVKRKLLELESHYA